MLLALAAVAALLFALPAHAQTSGTNTVLRNGYYFNSATNQKTNSAGDQKVEEVAKDRDLENFSTIITGTARTVGVYDSSGVVDARKWTRGGLWIRVRPVQFAGTDTTNNFTVLVQVRAHAAALDDSFNVAVSGAVTGGAVTAAGPYGDINRWSGTTPWVPATGEVKVTFVNMRWAMTPGFPVGHSQRSQPQAIFLSFEQLGWTYIPRYLSVRTQVAAAPTGVTTYDVRVDAEFKR